ncbi:MAG: NAD-dependent epimerase/dehydratase family protein [Betaproteobacteria bacterium]
MQRVLITGAAGAIGTTLRAGLKGVYPLLRLSDIRPVGDLSSGEDFMSADLNDAAAVARLMPGIDCVVHLGGVPREDKWEAILANNIVGTYNVFEAARKAGVKRVVFASSNHVIGFHRAARTVDIEAPVRPDSRYGVSKVFGEALGRLYADKHGLSVACLRIGSFRQRPHSARQVGKPARSHATRAALHRRARLPLPRALRRLQQHAHPVAQSGCRPHRLRAAG